MSISAAPLSSAAFFSPSIFAYKRSINQLADSAAKLSSGNRLIRASEDVASLSISTRMQSQIVSLRQAQSNAVQGSSMLQVAYDALSTIGDVIDSMSALATQANSSSLTSADRALLQVEFESYQDEIDRIAGNTKFNTINLLDGTLGGSNSVSTTTTDATQASATLTFTSLATTNTVKLNGVTFTGDTDFVIGGSIADSLDNLVTVLNNSTNTAISQATYSRVGNGLRIVHDAGGKLGNQYYINQGGSSSTFTTSGGATASANYYTLSGGLDNGLGFRTVRSTGTIGDALVNTQAQTPASVTLSFSSNASNTETLVIDDGNGSSVTFTYVASSASSTQITIGSSIEETITNTIKMLSQYSGSSDYGVRQLEFERSGSTLTIRNKNVGDPADFAAGADLDISETISGATISSTTLGNGVNTGVNTAGVANEDFIGEISGFTATYNSADNITASITVGDHTYTSTITDTTPASAAFSRFTSASGGYFDVQIAAGGLAVSNQSTANTFASRLNAAFAGLTFTQERIVSSFTGTGDLAGGSARIQLDDFATSTPRVRSIAVTTNGTTADIAINVGGETFTTGNIGTSIGAYETITLTSADDVAHTIKITMGAAGVSLANDTLASTFEEDLRDSFGLNAEGSGTSFQVGEDSTDTINVSVGAATAEQLFGSATPDISTQAGAASAVTVLETAKNTLMEIVSEVGAYQRRFDTAESVLDSSISGIDAARSALADTDITAESTRYAMATLQANAAIAVIAQTGQLQASMLKVLEIG